MKCKYCDFAWEDEEEYGKHLNATHTRCFYCSSVFSNDQFDDDYAICGKCRDKENEEDTSKWYNCAHCDAGYPDQECTCRESND